MTSIELKPYLLEVICTDAPLALYGLRSLPSWLQKQFDFDPTRDAQVWRMEADASKFWGLSGLAGQMENLARCVDDQQEAYRFAILRGLLNTAANQALAISKEASR